MAYEFQCHGVLYEAIRLSRNHLKLKKSELGRREGITIEGLTAEYPATLKLGSEWIRGYAVSKN